MPHRILRAGHPLPPLKPGVYERPVCRIRHTDPNGDLHQTTISSTWPARYEEDGFTKEEIQGHRLALITMLRSYYEGMGCEFISMQLVASSTTELDGSIGK